MNTNLFKKIIVNDNEIDLTQLYANNGKYTLGNGVEKATVKFFFDDEVTKIIPDDIFANNPQIVNIELNEEITVKDGAFAGLTNLSSESKEKLLDIIHVNPKSFKYNVTIGDMYWRIQPEHQYVDPWEITNANDELPELVIAIPNITVNQIEFTSSNTNIATINSNGIVTLTGNNGETILTAHLLETETYNEAIFTKTLSVNIQEEPDTPEVPKYYFSYGQTEITTDNYTTANGAQEIEEYPEESTYEAPATGYVYVLVKDDKTVQFVDPGFNDADITTVDTEANIEGYKVYRSAKIVETGIIKIKIS